MRDKPDKITKSDNEFKDVQAVSELSLKKLWLNKHDDVWDRYVKAP